jgi:hypothetical protein
MHRLVTAAAVAGILGSLLLIWRGTAPGAPALLADPVRTPGVLNPDVSQATIGQTICVHGWTRTIRPPSEYTSGLKLEQMREYGVGGDPSGYQEDHLISLELGGHPTDRRNLWPEPNPRATAVDRVENELNAKVCSGELTLAEAQRRESELKHRSG